MRLKVFTLTLAPVLFLVSHMALGRSPGPETIQGWFGLNTFHPPATPGHGHSLERSTVLNHLQSGSSFLLQADNNPLTVQSNSGQSHDVKRAVVARPFLLHLSSHLGLFRYGQFGFSIPFYVDNGTERKSTVGLGDIRLVAKGVYRFRIHGVQMGAGLSFPLLIPTGNPSYFTGEKDAAVEPCLSFDALFGKVLAVLNLGIVSRRTETRYGLTTGPQLIVGGGADVSILKKRDALKLTGEVSARLPLNSFSTGFAPVNMDTQVAYSFSNGIFLKLALGVGLSVAAGSPRARLVAGVGFTSASFARQEEKQIVQSVEDEDADGIGDDVDKCVKKAEDFDGFEDEDGCPESDNDGDGILDIDDKCPDRAENEGNITDSDGCPKMDSDGDGIIDELDKCPAMAEDEDGFDDEDGCPDDDNDADGVKDSEDMCQLLPELAGPLNEEEEELNSLVIVDGCPETFRLEENSIIAGKRVEFKPFKAEFSTDVSLFFDELAQVVQFKRDWKGLLLKVYYVMEQHDFIAEDRVMLVRGELLERGIDADSIATEVIQLEKRPRWNVQPNDGTLEIEVLFKEGQL